MHRRKSESAHWLRTRRLVPDRDSAGKLSRHPYRSNSFSIHWRIDAYVPSQPNNAFQAKAGDPVNLPQGFLELILPICAQPPLQSFEDSEFVASFDCIQKRKSKFLPVSPVEVKQPGILSTRQSIEPCPCLFVG